MFPNFVVLKGAPSFLFISTLPEAILKFEFSVTFDMKVEFMELNKN